MDAVWLRLTNKDNEETYYMFGSGAVINFTRGDNDMTLLFYADRCAGEVKEEPAYIQNTIGAVRGTVKAKGKHVRSDGEATTN